MQQLVITSCAEKFSAARRSVQLVNYEYIRCWGGFEASVFSRGVSRATHQRVNENVLLGQNRTALCYEEYLSAAVKTRTLARGRFDLMAEPWKIVARKRPAVPPPFLNSR